MPIQIVDFSSGSTNLERFLHKNKHTQRKLLNFDHFSNIIFFKLILSKNVNNKKCAPKLVFFNEKKRFVMIFDIEN
jgi:hypothetical protein